MPLDLSSLRKAVDALQSAIEVATGDGSDLNQSILDAIRAGVIHYFKVAYEQCWQVIQRWLRENQTPEDADFPRTRKDLFRAAARYGLIADPVVWFDYSDARNLTSHTYSEQQAAVIFESAQRFVNDARLLLEKLESLND